MLLLNLRVHLLIISISLFFYNNPATRSPQLILDQELMKSVKQNDTDSVKRLLAKGANPNYHDILGITPLMAACTIHNLIIIKALLGAGANASINYINPRFGTTAFALASFFRPDPLIINTLLENGADPFIQDCSNRPYIAYLDNRVGLENYYYNLINNRFERRIVPEAIVQEAIVPEEIVPKEESGFKVRILSSLPTSLPTSSNESPPQQSETSSIGSKRRTTRPKKKYEEFRSRLRTLLPTGTVSIAKSEPKTPASPIVSTPSSIVSSLFSPVSSSPFSDSSTIGMPSTPTPVTPLPPAELIVAAVVSIESATKEKKATEMFKCAKCACQFNLSIERDIHEKKPHCAGCQLIFETELDFKKHLEFSLNHLKGAVIIPKKSDDKVILPCIYCNGLLCECNLSGDYKCLNCNKFFCECNDTVTVPSKKRIRVDINPFE